MAFGTIEWDGRGVIANCDGLSDSIGGTWAELGGGGISYNTDQYLTGAGSIGHVYAAKSGFGYYTTPITYNFDTGGNEEGQFIYIWINISSSSAFDTLANNGFSFVVGTDTSNYRTYKLVGSGAGENNGWTTGWKLFVFDPTIAGSIADVGTFNLATINMVGLWMDTIASVRADTIFIDQVAIARGLRVVDGSGTMDEIIAYCAKTLGTRAWGVFQYKGRFYYSAGSLTVGDNVNATADTALTSSGSIIGYEVSEFYHDTNGWSLTHPSNYNQINLEKHASFNTDYTATDTGVFGAIDANLSISSEAGATLNYSGGSFEELSAIVMNADQDISNAVLSKCSTRNINGGAFNYNTLNLCDTVTASSTGSCTGNSFKNSIGAVSLVVATLADAEFNSFVSDGSNHAIELTTIGGGSMNWNSDITGYDTGATGSPVTPTNTGNEAIYVSATSGTVTINVDSGYAPPSIRSAGAIVNVVAGQVTLQVEVLDDATGLGIELAHIIMLKASDKSLIMDGATNASGIYSELLTYSEDIPFVGWARQWDISGDDYVSKDFSGTITSTGSSITVRLQKI